MKYQGSVHNEWLPYNVWVNHREWFSKQEDLYLLWCRYGKVNLDIETLIEEYEKTKAGT